MKKMKFVNKNFASLFSFVFVAFLVVTPVTFIMADKHATVPAPKTTSITVKLKNPIKANSIPKLIQTILEGIIKIAIPIIALAIIYSGFLFVAARGKPEAITKAKDAFLYTCIGAAILLGAWALAKLIAATVTSLS